MSTLSTANIQTKSANTPPVIKDVNGTECGQFCRAWVNFNGTGTVAIRDSFNVSSITDNGTGNYTVTFTTAMANANYSAITTGHIFTTGSPENVRDMSAQDLAAGSFRYCSGYTTGTLQDSANCFAAVFGG